MPARWLPRCLSRAWRRLVSLLEARRHQVLENWPEAMDCFEWALALLAGLPDVAPRAELELALQTAQD